MSWVASRHKAFLAKDNSTKAHSEAMYGTYPKCQNILVNQ